MNFRQKVAVFLATGFYVGNIPFAPGTFGIPLPGAIIAGLVFIGLAVWVSNDAARTLKRKDPGCIVIDEMAGMVVTLFGLPFNPTSVIIGFILFRILDIVKPFPIRMIDKRVSGGLGIVADDVVAGIIANILMHILFLFLDRY